MRTTRRTTLRVSRSKSWGGQITTQSSLSVLFLSCCCLMLSCFVAPVVATSLSSAGGGSNMLLFGEDLCLEDPISGVIMVSGTKERGKEEGQGKSRADKS